MAYRVGAGEVAIVLRPIIEEDGEWHGNISTGLIFGSEKHPEAMKFALDIAVTMAATDKFLDDYPEYLDDYDYYKNLILKEIFPEAHAEATKQVEEEKRGYTKDGNIIRLTPWTKTEGNA